MGVSMDLMCYTTYFLTPLYIDYCLHIRFPYWYAFISLRFVAPLTPLVSVLVIWGAGIVLFLAKMINLHNSNTQGFWVELCQQIETGLFTATSIGLIPFRALDTWRMFSFLTSMLILH